MRRALASLVASVAVIFVVFAFPNLASADTLNAPVTVSWADPTTVVSTTIDVGSRLSCPTAGGAFCVRGLPFAPDTISVGSLSITYTSTGTSVLPSGGFDGLVFSGLSFLSDQFGVVGLGGVTIDPSSTMGITNADLTWTDGGSVLDVNLAGLPAGGSFTLDLIADPPANAPEPGTLLLLGTGLLGLLGLALIQRHRLPV
jgi:hypothetical protein